LPHRPWDEPQNAQEPQNPLVSVRPVVSVVWSARGVPSLHAPGLAAGNHCSSSESASGRTTAGKRSSTRARSPWSRAGGRPPRRLPRLRRKNSASLDRWPMVLPWAHLTSSAWISSCGVVSIVAPMERMRLRLAAGSRLLRVGADLDGTEEDAVRRPSSTPCTARGWWCAGRRGRWWSGSRRAACPWPEQPVEVGSRRPPCRARVDLVARQGRPMESRLSPRRWRGPAARRGMTQVRGLTGASRRGATTLQMQRSALCRPPRRAQDRAASWRDNLLSIGAALSRHEVDACSHGGPRSTSTGCSRPRARSTSTARPPSTTRPAHHQRELYKGVLDGRAHGVFLGSVKVRADAQKTDSQQTNRNLILSMGATMDTTPSWRSTPTTSSAPTAAPSATVQGRAVLPCAAAASARRTPPALGPRASRTGAGAFPGRGPSAADSLLEQWFACRKPGACNDGTPRADQTTETQTHRTNGFCGSCAFCGSSHGRCGKARPRQAAQDFPILAEKVSRQTPRYLDNAATSQKAAAILDAVPPSTSTTTPTFHPASTSCRACYARLRGRPRQGAGLQIHAKSREEIVLHARHDGGHSTWWPTRSCAPASRPATRSSVSVMDTTPTSFRGISLARRLARNSRSSPISDAGELDLKAYASCSGPRRGWSPSPRLQRAGTINPAEDIIGWRTPRRCPSSSTARRPCRTWPSMSKHRLRLLRLQRAQDVRADGHRRLSARRNCSRRWPPWQGGGDMIRSLSFEGTTLQRLPYKFEAAPRTSPGNRAGAPPTTCRPSAWTRRRAETTCWPTRPRRCRGQGPPHRRTAARKAGVVSFVTTASNPPDIAASSTATACHPHRPPLRPALMDRYRLPRHLPRQPRPVQHEGRRRRAGRVLAEGRGDVHVTDDALRDLYQDTILQAQQASAQLPCHRRRRPQAGGLQPPGAATAHLVPEAGQGNASPTSASRGTAAPSARVPPA